MKIPNINKLSKASQLSLLAIVILLGAVFFTVNNALQTESGASHASSAIVYQSGKYYCYYLGLTFQCSTPTTAPIHPLPTATPTPKQTTCIVRPTCAVGRSCPQYIGVVYCNPTPTSMTLPTATPVPTRTPTAVPTPTTFINPTPTPTPTVAVLPTTVAPTSTPTPTPSPIPGDTTLNLILGLHGIGNAGDSANPNSDGNMNPLHPTRTVTVTIYDAQNQQVVSQQGSVHYDSTRERFLGTIDLGSSFVTGLYTVKIQTSQYLRGLVPGIQTITSGTVSTLPYTALVAGDVNGDNQINILDYNLLMGCYSDLLPAASCTSVNNVLTDLTDDGNVNQFDYNLFLRELSNVSGQ